MKLINNESIKYPKQLIKNETKNKIEIDLQQNLFIEEDAKNATMQEITNAQRKSLLSLEYAFPYIFDGIAYICTHYPYIINKNDNVYYSTKLNFKDFKKACIGNNKITYLRYFKKELLKLIKNDTEKKYIIRKDGSIIFARPIIIIPVLNGLKNISELPNEIDEIEIKFSKDLFEEVVNTKENSNGFIQIPPFFQANIQLCTDMVKNAGIVSNINANDCRMLFETLSIHDNGISQIVKIPLLDYVESNCPQYLKKTTKKNNEIKYSVPKSRIIELKQRIENEIETFSLLLGMKEMEGARFVPASLEDIDTDSKKAQYIYISVLRPKSKTMPSYNIDKIDADFSFINNVMENVFYNFIKIMKSKECIDLICLKKISILSLMQNQELLKKGKTNKKLLHIKQKKVTKEEILESLKAMRDNFQERMQSYSLTQEEIIQKFIELLDIQGII